jgi:hypothetical protein
VGKLSHKSSYVTYTPAAIGTALARTWIPARVGLLALAAFPLVLAALVPVAGDGARHPPTAAGVDTPAE